MIVNNQYNIGYICSRQQFDKVLSEKVAFRWISSQKESHDYTFHNLDTCSNRFSNVLTALGFVPGDILFTFLFHIILLILNNSYNDPKLDFETFFNFIIIIKAIILPMLKYATKGHFILPRGI